MPRYAPSFVNGMPGMPPCIGRGPSPGAGQGSDGHEPENQKKMGCTAQPILRHRPDRALTRREVRTTACSVVGGLNRGPAFGHECRKPPFNRRTLLPYNTPAAHAKRRTAIAQGGDRLEKCPVRALNPKRGV
ncbi:hypothetical protein GCM10009097_43210 [Pigmentiphaga daeguensis]|uniref:Uncharacterized protein n=1 Tax=Pigmentiphaga daeguensis TaxID=414049 RepID=A0ABN1CM44_9BURK